MFLKKKSAMIGTTGTQNLKQEVKTMGAILILPLFPVLLPVLLFELIIDGSQELATIMSSIVEQWANYFA